MSGAATSKAQRSPKARKTKDAAPFSPAVAKLISQVQAEARELLLNELSAKDTITVLHGFDAETKRVKGDGNSIHISDHKGNSLRMDRQHQEPASWANSSYMGGYWHPARWYGDLTLKDAHGNQWTRSLNIHVCDDFGNLVEAAV